MTEKVKVLEEDRDEVGVNRWSTLRPKISLPIKKPVPSSRISKVLNTHINNKKASYTGPLRENLPNGTGVVRFESRETYFGEVVNGEMHGHGTTCFTPVVVWTEAALTTMCFVVPVDFQVNEYCFLSSLKRNMVLVNTSATWCWCRSFNSRKYKLILR
jgi:hypothetical protein